MHLQSWSLWHLKSTCCRPPLLKSIFAKQIRGLIISITPISFISYQLGPPGTRAHKLLGEYNFKELSHVTSRLPLIVQTSDYFFIIWPRKSRTRLLLNVSCVANSKLRISANHNEIMFSVISGKIINLVILESGLFWSSKTVGRGGWGLLRPSYSNS